MANANLIYALRQTLNLYLIPDTRIDDWISRGIKESEIETFLNGRRDIRLDMDGAIVTTLTSYLIGAGARWVVQRLQGTGPKLGQVIDSSFWDLRGVGLTVPHITKITIQDDLSGATRSFGSPYFQSWKLVANMVRHIGLLENRVKLANVSIFD